MTDHAEPNDDLGPAATGRSLPIALLRAREAVMERYRPHLASCGVTEQQWRVLRVLAESGPLEAGLVAQAACILPPSLTRITRTLDAAGWVTARRAETDGRRLILTLTEEGYAFLRANMAESIRLSRQIAEELGQDTIARLLDDLERVTRALTRPPR